MTAFPRQCAILVGGLGTRLGELTSATPKPLLPVGDRPFLHWLMREMVRFGVNDFVLLAGFASAQVEEFARLIATSLPKKVKVTVSIEPEASGTGGAVWHARNLFQSHFLLANGDSWFDVNLAEFTRPDVSPNGVLGRALLRRMTEGTARFGAVELEGGYVKTFLQRPLELATGLINAGIYHFDRRIVDHLSPRCSLEADILPHLATGRMLAGTEMDGFFIDIGIPEDYRRAQIEVPVRLRRGAVFFDRDGVLNEDLGWVGHSKNFQWKRGALAALREVNQRGMHAFVVTNQGGIARGFYSEAEMRALHAWMDDQISLQGAVIDDWRWCPHHPEAATDRYRVACDCRKPEPGMIKSLIGRWEVDVSKSLLIGDQQTDLQAAAAAGVPSSLYDGATPLNEVLRGLLRWNGEQHAHFELTMKPKQNSL